MTTSTLARQKSKLKHLFAAILLSCLLLFAPEPIYSQDDLPQVPHSKITSQTQEPLILNDDQDQYPLGQHLELLEDTNKQWTIEDVTSPELSQKFVPNQDEVPNFGFTDSAFWVRFRAKDLADEPVMWVLAVESNLFFIDVYVPASNPGQYQVTQTGTFLPFNSREIEHPKFLFNLPLTSEEEQTIYLRLESEASMNFPLAIWSAEAVSQDDLVQQVLNGFIYGVLLIMAGYNLILSLYLRDRSYFYYFLFLFFLFLSFLVDDSFAHQYLWPNQGRINAIGGQLFFVLTIMAALKFTASFLPTKEYVPRLHRAINIVVIVFALLLPIQLFDIGLTARPNLILTLISYILIVAAGILVARRGYRPARYFLLAWLFLLTSILIFVISLFVFLPQGIFAETGAQIGIVVMTLTLSLALADRINTYRQEKEAAEEATMQEAERRRMAVTGERLRIAQDLHDSVTQSLYSVNLFAEAGREIVDAGDVQSASHYFTRIGSTSQQALKEMRLFLYELRPPDVVEEGLVDALQKRLDAVEKRSGMEARLLLNGAINYPDDVTDQFYRISQEALNNVVKHAQADEVTVYLRASSGIMGLEIVDNGVGFDLTEAGQDGGMGLEIMQERSAQINGDFTINTAPDQGTTIQVEVKKTDE